MYCFEGWQRNTLSILIKLKSNPSYSSISNYATDYHIFIAAGLTGFFNLCPSKILWHNSCVISANLRLFHLHMYLAQTISPLNMYDFFSFFHCHDSFIWCIDVWLTFLTKKNSERIERRHKLHHLWLSSDHILHICRYQSIYFTMGCL